MRRFHKNTASVLGSVDLMHGAPACGGGDPKSDGSQTRTVRSSPAGSPSPTSDAWKNQYNAAQLKTHDALRRSIISVVALGALALTAAACGGDDKPETLPTPTTSTSSTPTQSPTPTAPAWQSKFTEEQLAEYNDALDRWSTYEQRSEPIWAAGNATPAAEALFKEFFLNPDAQFQALQTYEQNKIKTEGTPQVYWSMATAISDPKKAASKGMATTIQQCVDYRNRTVTANGKPSALKKKFQRPLIREISMTKLGGTTWLIAGVDDLSDGKAKPCDPTS